MTISPCGWLRRVSPSVVTASEAHPSDGHARGERVSFPRSNQAAHLDPPLAKLKGGLSTSGTRKKGGGVRGPPCSRAGPRAMRVCILRLDLFCVVVSHALE